MHPSTGAPVLSLMISAASQVLGNAMMTMELIKSLDFSSPELLEALPKHAKVNGRPAGTQSQQLLAALT